MGLGWVWVAAETLSLGKLGSSLTQVISLGTSECCDGVGVGGQTTFPSVAYTVRRERLVRDDEKHTSVSSCFRNVLSNVS